VIPTEVEGPAEAANPATPQNCHPEQREGPVVSSHHRKLLISQRLVIPTEVEGPAVATSVILEAALKGIPATSKI
jgi:hypothetical protein